MVIFTCSKYTSNKYWNSRKYGTCMETCPRRRPLFTYNTLFLYVPNVLRFALSSRNVRYEWDYYCLLGLPTEDRDIGFILKVPTCLYQARQCHIAERSRLIFIVHTLHSKHKIYTVTQVRTHWKRFLIINPVC